MTDAEIIRAAVAAGWSYTPVSLYDEEGIDGFRWDGPNGEEFYGLSVSGDWSSGPAVPDEVRGLFDAAFAASQERAKAAHRDFVDFIRRLMGN
jgi:hypothetical protein